ncbi:hypothetical protein V2J09_017891 [Rumex salicifolius]
MYHAENITRTSLNVSSSHTSHNNASNIERRIILPPSFIGGPKDVKRKYFNVMMLVQMYEKPYLFITMKCNQN